MIRQFRIKQQCGDTIMEVMICIAILGFVLAAAFGLASRNQTSARQSQERSEALQIADGQLELLRSYAGLYKLPDTTHRWFCLTDNPDPTTDDIDIVDQPASGPPANAAADTNPDSYNSACRQGTDQRYWVTIWSGNQSIPPRQPSAALGAQAGVYVVTVRWDSAGGDIPREETNIFYAITDASLPNYSP